MFHPLSSPMEESCPQPLCCGSHDQVHLGMSRRRGQPQQLQHQLPEMLLVATASLGCSFLSSIGSLSIFGKEL